MAPQIYLVTGSNRGIGRGIVTELLKRPATIVIATVRDPSQDSSRSLSSLSLAQGSELIVVKIDHGKDGDTAALVAISQLVTAYPKITHLDTVIANAGLGRNWVAASASDFHNVREHFEVNTVGSLAVFQATLPLLQKSRATAGPKFVAISTIVGSIGLMEEVQFQSTICGASKAALNYITRKIHMENPHLIAFALHPGWVQTDMGNDLAKLIGVETAPITIEQSVEGVLKEIDIATRENTSGHFRSFDGQELPW